MKVSVCDICVLKEKTLTASKFNASFGNPQRKVNLQVCLEHRDPFKNAGVKTFQEALQLQLECEQAALAAGL